MEKKLIVSLDWQGENSKVGELLIYETKGSEYYLFEYNRDWVNHTNAFPIDPELPLNQIPAQSKNLWGAFQDISPDRWGQLLQDKASQKFLSAADYMLGVSDYMRLGALRLSDRNEPETYLASHNEIPKLAQIRALESAVRKFESHEITDNELNLLLEPGSSMGGARPKAVVEDNGKLYIAKFPSKKDDYRVINWEAALLDLSRAAGINTAESRLLNKESEFSVLLVERFDRKGSSRIPFVSAMTMLSGNRENNSYIDLADIIKMNSGQFKLDSYELWKRMTFNALAGNTDDHMRNHGFLRSHQGWRLSPAYDLNPNPLDYKKHIHATSFDGEITRPSLDLCIELAAYYGLDKNSVDTGLKSIGNALRQMDKIVEKNGLSKPEIQYMEKALKHEDTEKLLRLTTKSQTKTQSRSL